MEEARACSQFCERELNGCLGLRTRTDDCGLCPHPAYHRRICLGLPFPSVSFLSLGFGLEMFLELPTDCSAGALVRHFYCKDW